MSNTLNNNSGIGRLERATLVQPPVETRNDRSEARTESRVKGAEYTEASLASEIVKKSQIVVKGSSLFRPKVKCMDYNVKADFDHAAAFAELDILPVQNEDMLAYAVNHPKGAAAVVTAAAAVVAAAAAVTMATSAAKSAKSSSSSSKSSKGK